MEEKVEEKVEEPKATAPKGKKLVTGRGGKEWYEDIED